MFIELSDQAVTKKQWNRITDVAPLQRGRITEPWKGCQTKKPWEYAVTAMIPVYQPGPQLELIIELLRLQTIRPYIVLVDTGSPLDKFLALNNRFSTDEDIEIHAIRSNGYRGSSEPIAAAIDLALAACHTRWMYLTHDDVFPRRRDLLEWEIWLSERYETPVVGWEMSDRSHVCGDDWRGMVSHTSTIMDLSKLDGMSWSMRRAHERYGIARVHASWPDTETGFNLLLRSSQIKPLLLGPEINYQRQTTRWWDHCRSFTGSGLYSPEHRAKALEWVKACTDEAIARIELWSTLSGTSAESTV